MDQNNNKIVKWDKVADIKFVTDAFSGILAVGQSGICNPMEGKSIFKDTGFISCAPYFNGHILLADKITVIETYERKFEVKWSFDLVDAATIGTVTYIVTKTGEIFYSDKFGSFTPSLAKYEMFNSINSCDPYFVMSGKHTIVIHDSRSANRNSFRNVTIANVDFKAAYIYDETKLVALTSDNRIMYMPDFSDMTTIYMADLFKITQTDVNNIYVNNKNLYLLCNKGRIVMIRDFKLSDTDNYLEIYGSVFGDADWKSMIYKDDETKCTIVVGHGHIDRSLLKIANFDNYIIENDLINAPIVKRSYGHLVTMMDRFFNGHVTYTFYDIHPAIDILYRRCTISLPELLVNYGYIDDISQTDKIDWSKASVCISWINPSKPDVIYDYTIDENGILTISFDKNVKSEINILLMLGGDKI